MAQGIAGLTLMENAGRAVAAVVRARHRPMPTLVACGPGNNGGDGFVVARLLAEAGWPARLALLGERARLAGDAAAMAARWTGPIEPLDEGALQGANLVIDGLFGAGLSRPLDGVAARFVAAANASGRPIVAIDVPSGLEGDTGAHRGPVIRAATTVTFFRPKPGHLLFPGRGLCGELIVAPIGIPASVLEGVGPRAWRNGPDVWELGLRPAGADDHKYTRGHALIVGGGETSSGAARLAARAALRVGAGLATTVVAAAAAPVHAAHQTSVMIDVADDDAGFGRALADARRNALLIGPGAGRDERTRRRVAAVLATGRAAVFDADALTAFADDPPALFRDLGPHVLLTPHDGEYARLFTAEGDRLSRARAAAAASGAVVLLKGADTVVAAPDGRAVINTNAPAWLATAGSGDVLAGMAVGLMAQGLGAFAAGATAAWLHGAAAAALAPGLISEDLVEAIPAALARVTARRAP
jgi:NAD(P)H-hydrate epimerase